MNSEKAAKQLAELGHATRLNIFRLLVKAGNGGLPVSDIQQALDIPGSTLSHHLSRLVNVGLLAQQRDGRILQCTAQFAVIAELVNFLTEECCAGQTS